MGRPPRRRTPQSISLAALLLLLCCGSACGRTVSVADLHGDYERSLLILKHAGLINPDNLKYEDKPVWTGGNTYLVQTGDIVDRGADGKKIYELFMRIARESAKADGTSKVINLMGNHELMNIQGDLRYVTPGDPGTYLKPGEKNADGPTERAKAWAADGWLGKWVRSFSVVAIRDGVLFCHAGLPEKFIEPARTQLRRSTTERQQLIREINSNFGDAFLSSSLLETDNDWFFDDNGPLWNRFYSMPNDDQAMCDSLGKVLEATGAKRMVVGHTIQEDSGGHFHVRTDCGGRLVLADTAISRAYGGVSSYLIHDGKGGVKAVYPELGGEQQELPPVHESEELDALQVFPDAKENDALLRIRQQML